MPIRKKCCVIALFTAVCMITSCSDNTMENGIALKDNQSVKYAVIDEISGNEITIRWAQQKEITAENMTISQDDNKKNGQDESIPDSQMPQDTGMPGGQGVQNMPDMPDMNNGGHDNVQDVSKGSSKDKVKETENKQVDRKIYTYEAEGEAEVMMIPVGTPVYTIDDTKTTFSRLASNDVVELVVEELEDGTEAIIEVRMVG